MKKEEFYIERDNRPFSTVYLFEPQDLRIGIWMSEIGTSGHVHYFRANIDYIETLLVEPDAFSPIPLSSEILGKIGFVTVAGDPSLFISRSAKGDRYLLVHLNPEATTSILLGGDDFPNIPLKKDVQCFVHDLQNLSYYLLDKELEINL